MIRNAGTDRPRVCKPPERGSVGQANRHGKHWRERRSQRSLNGGQLFSPAHLKHGRGPIELSGTPF